jgi:hypothetical protein
MSGLRATGRPRRRPARGHGPSAATGRLVGAALHIAQHIAQRTCSALGGPAIDASVVLAPCTPMVLPFRSGTSAPQNFGAPRSDALPEASPPAPGSTVYLFFLGWGRGGRKRGVGHDAAAEQGAAERGLCQPGSRMGAEDWQPAVGSTAFPAEPKAAQGAPPGRQQGATPRAGHGRLLRARPRAHQAGSVELSPNVSAPASDSREGVSLVNEPSTQMA